MGTTDKYCWNCERALQPLRSKRSGIEYCAACGAAIDGVGWIPAEDLRSGMTRRDTTDEGANDGDDSDRTDRSKGSK
jgi:hypothetical protein